MDGRDAMLFNSESVVFCGISLVFSEIVLGIFKIISVHDGISGNLGDNRRTGNVKTFSVSFHNRSAMRVRLESESAVNKNKVWFNP